MKERNGQLNFQRGEELLSQMVDPAYFLILIVVAFLGIEIFRTIRIRRALGRVQFRVVKIYRNIFLFLLSVFVIVLIPDSVNFIDWDIEKRYIYPGQMFGDTMVLVGILTVIISLIRGDEIREEGITSGGVVYGWEDLENFRIVKKGKIEIATNKETFITRETRKVKWSVQEKNVEEIKNLLNQHLRETK